MDLTNALEMTWTLPYEIPNDRTEAVITCETQQKPAANNPATKYSHDPLRIYQSSVMTKGWGTGNCFYQGVLVAAPGKHVFLCRNTGKLAKAASLQLAFQFTLSSEGKAFVEGAINVATNNVVNLVAKTLTCQLKISTYATATTSTVEWYKSSEVINIDGANEANLNG